MILNRRRDLWMRQTIAAIVSVTLVWTPFSLVWADRISDAGAAGQSAADVVSGRFQVPSVSGVWGAGGAGQFSYFDQNGDQVAIPVTDIFRDADPALAGDYASTYTDDAAAAQLGYRSRTQMGTGGSGTDQAYQAYVDSRNNLPRPDLSADPLWRTTDTVLADLDTFEQDFADCETDTVLTEGGIPTHVPDIRRCSRPQAPFADCEITHDYTIPVEEKLYEVIEGAQYVYSCGEGCIDIWLGLQPFAPGPYPWGEPIVNEGHVRIRFPRPNLIIGAVLDYVYSVPAGSPAVYNTLTMNGLYVVRSGIYQPPPPGEPCWFSCPVNYWGLFGGNPAVDLTAYFRSGYVDLGFRENGAFSYFTGYSFSDINARYRVRFVVPPPPQQTDAWYPQSCIDDALQIRQTQACSGTLVVTDGPDGTGCVTLADGRRVCEGSPEADTLQPAPLPGISRLVRKVRLSGVQCFYDPSRDTCRKYQDDPGCGFISSECRSRDELGNCLLFQETYDCGTDVVVPTLDRKTTYQCAGPVRCLGADCFTPATEQSRDFARASAALQAAQFLKMDTACASADLNGCTVFQGTDERCKVPLGGSLGDLVVDCCDQDSGVNLDSYISLLMKMGKIDSAIMARPMQGTAVRAAWETLRSPFTDTWGTVRDLFANSWDTLTGSTRAAATEAAKEGLIGTFQQELINSVADWVGNTFSSATQNILFTQGANGWVLNPVIGTALGWIMAAYAVYSIVLFLLNWIFACEQSDFRAVSNRQLRNCHYVGTYCSDPYEILFVSGCWEEKQTYCCFNSPLSRIIQQQLRPQLGIGWGTPEYPNCQGLTVNQIRNADWSQVNLDEWLGILHMTGNLPTPASLDIDALTGAGNAYNVNGRIDAARRTVDRIDGIDTDRLRRDARDELRGAQQGQLGVP